MSQKMEPKQIRWFWFGRKERVERLWNTRKWEKQILPVLEAWGKRSERLSRQSSSFSSFEEERSVKRRRHAGESERGWMKVEYLFHNKHRVQIDLQHRIVQLPNYKIETLILDLLYNLHHFHNNRLKSQNLESFFKSRVLVWDTSSVQKKNVPSEWIPKTKREQFSRGRSGFTKMSFQERRTT